MGFGARNNRKSTLLKHIFDLKKYTLLIDLLGPDLKNVIPDTQQVLNSKF